MLFAAHFEGVPAIALNNLHNSEIQLATGSGTRIFSTYIENESDSDLPDDE